MPTTDDSQCNFHMKRLVIKEEIIISMCIFIRKNVEYLYGEELILAVCMLGYRSKQKFLF